MKPPIRRQVDALFEKVSLYNLNKVDARLRGQAGMADVARDLERGRAIWAEGPEAIEAARAGVNAAESVGNALLKPINAGSKPILKGLGWMGEKIRNSPRLMRMSVGGLLMAPILGKAFRESQNNFEDTAMAIRRDPDRVVIASLNDFLEKRAQEKQASLGSFARPIPGAARDSFASGVGSGIGTGLVQALFGGIGKAYDGAKNALVVDGKRKALLDSVLRQDPLLAEAMNRTPEMAQSITEAYATMARFAPTLSLDVNAVRAFLREVVLGGAGVNYATIKNLADAERAVSQSRE